jgi:hypothetical protein
MKKCLSVFCFESSINNAVEDMTPAECVISERVLIENLVDAGLLSPSALDNLCQENTTATRSPAPLQLNMQIDQPPEAPESPSYLSLVSKEHADSPIVGQDVVQGTHCPTDPVDT